MVNSGENCQKRKKTSQACRTPRTGVAGPVLRGWGVTSVLIERDLSRYMFRYLNFEFNSQEIDGREGSVGGVAGRERERDGFLFVVVHGAA